MGNEPTKVEIISVVMIKAGARHTITFEPSYKIPKYGQLQYLINNDLQFSVETQVPEKLLNDTTNFVSELLRFALEKSRT